MLLFHCFNRIILRTRRVRTLRAIVTENETGAHAVEVAHVTEMIDEEGLARESVVDVRDLMIGDRKFLAN